MTTLARRKRLVVGAAALLLATAGVAVQGRQQPATPGGQDQVKQDAPPAAGAAAEPHGATNRELARTQLALIDQALGAMHQLARNGRLSFSDASFSLWERRRLDTLRRAGAGKAEIVAALEKQLETLKMEEAIAREAHERARATIIPIYDVQFRRMETEIWLNEEKAR